MPPALHRAAAAAAAPPARRFAFGCAAGALGLGGLLGTVHAATTTPWPEVPDPPRAKVEWVARDSRVNGLPTRIEHFDSELSPPEIIAYYRAFWAREPAGAPHERQIGAWQTISTVHGPFQMAVQVQARKPQGSTGMLSVANFGEARKDWVPRDWPRWSDTVVVQVTESSDGPKRSEYVAMVSRADFDATVLRWREEWTRRGYSLTRENSAPAAGGGDRAWLAMFNKAPGSVDVTVTWNAAERRTLITANRLEPLQ